MTPTQPPYSHHEQHRINLADAQEVAYWTSFFQCTELALREAAALTGSSLLEDVWCGLGLLHYIK